MTAALKLRISLGLVLVFAAGFATGVFAGAWHAHRVFGERHGPRMADRMREHLQHELNLTPEQLQKMQPILDDTANRLQEIRADSGRRVSQILDESHRQLASYLTAEQQAQLQKLQERHHRSWRWHHGPPPPPGPDEP